VTQTLSGLSGRLSQGESDFTLAPGGSSEGRVGLILPPYTSMLLHLQEIVAQRKNWDKSWRFSVPFARKNLESPAFAWGGLTPSALNAVRSLS